MGTVEDAAVTLFTFPHSWYAQRARIALEEKGVPYTPIEIDFANRPQLFLESNPIYKKVPTIIYHGKPVAESLIILEFLEDELSQKAPLLPKDAYEKSQVRFWADYIYKNTEKLVAPARAKAGSPEQKAAQEGSIEVLKTLETAMTTFSTDGPFFTGEKFGFLDVVAAPFRIILMLLEKLGGVVVPGPEELPRLHKCVEAIAARQSYKAVVPSKEESLEFFTASFERKRKAAAEAAAAAAAASN